MRNCCCNVRGRIPMSNMCSMQGGTRPTRKYASGPTATQSSHQSQRQHKAHMQICLGAQEKPLTRSPPAGPPQTSKLSEPCNEKRKLPAPPPYPVGCGGGGLRRHRRLVGGGVWLRHRRRRGREGDGVLRGGLSGQGKSNKRASKRSRRNVAS